MAVACAQAGTVELWDPRTLERVAVVPVPNEPRWLAAHPTAPVVYVSAARGRIWSAIAIDDDPTVDGVWYPRLRGGLDRLRPTGDPAVSVDGRWLAFPVLDADVETPELEAAFGAVPYYQAGRFRPGLLVVPLEPDGGVGDGEAYAFVDVVSRHGSGYPSSVTAAPDGLGFVATMETNGALVWVDAPFSFTGAIRNLVVAEVAAGPRGVVFLTRDDAVSHSFLDPSLTRVDAAAMSELAARPVSWGVPDVALPPTVRLESTLGDDVAAGRRLFYTGGDGVMGALGGGVACATCHFDGRADGLTWPLFTGPRNTPSLAGGIADTAPFTWSNAVATIADEAQITNVQRMGGSVLTPEQGEQIAAFIEQIPAVDLPADAADAVARGAERFDALGCAACHSGAAYTDGLSHAMFGLEAVDTPSLRGVGATAPYFHDGSASTLEAVLGRAAAGEMGPPASLTPDEAADLSAFLRSL